MTKSKEKQERRESPAGYHYLAAYRQNPRHWYLKYILGLRPAFTPTYFVWGGAIHEGKEAYFKQGFSTEALLKGFEAEMLARQAEYQDGMKFNEDLERGLTLLKTWAANWREHDAKRYDIIEVEQQHEFMIGPDENYLFTVRPDRFFYDKEEKIYVVFDTKTSSWSPKEPFQKAQADDQLTGYIWALRKAYPDKPVARAEIDVLYNRQSVYQAARPGYVTRSDLDLTLFEMGMVGTITEIAQKYKSLVAGVPWPVLFWRNGEDCGGYGGNDPYEKICRVDVKPGEVPMGFKRDPWVDLKESMEIAGAWKLT